MNLQINLSELTLENIGDWPAQVKAIVAIFLSIAIVFAIYWLDTKDQVAALQGVEKQEVRLRQDFEHKQQQTANLPQLRAQLAEMKKIFGDMLRQLPSKTEIPGLLEDISKMGLAAGLEFRLFDPEPEMHNDFYAVLPIQIAVVGSYHQLADFISRVANLNRIVTLHEFSVERESVSKRLGRRARRSESKTDNSVVDGKLLMKIKAKTYRYLEEGETSDDVAKKNSNKGKG